MDIKKITRKQFLYGTAGGLLLSQWPFSLNFARAAETIIEKRIPKTKQIIAPIGMGTWITFNVGNSITLRQQRLKVLKTFFDMQGEVVDSSPMYGSSEEVVGDLYNKLDKPQQLFSATKIWTDSTSEGVVQHKDSLRLWKSDHLDLQQVHNLSNWQGHLKKMKEYKKAGQVKYIGITTSHGRRHNELIQIMKSEPIDFIQVTYNIKNREVEDKILPLAKEMKIAVIANRPYDGGSLMDQYKSKALPKFAIEAGITSWAEYFLKWIISHPSITVAIPATTQVKHMKENMNAMRGKIFAEALRNQLVEELK